MSVKKINPQDFRQSLLAWFDKNGRDLPWRYKGGAHPNPYHVWLSEIMLQQTTVQAVKDYFLSFIKIWPTVSYLANARQEEVTAAWAGLGYYSRARNLHKCALEISENYGGAFPVNETALLRLPGIGPYTASAIRSIAFNKPANVVDGNVERIMARIFALKVPFPKGKEEAKVKAAHFIGDFEGRHSDYVQALMDLGAMICTPKSPKCALCPISRYCAAYKHGLAEDLPKREPKKATPQKYGTAYIFINNQNELLLERRPEKGLLASMIGFPSTQWNEKKEREGLLSSVTKELEIKELPEVRHVFTHFKLQLKPILVRCEREHAEDLLSEGIKGSYFWQNIEDIDADHLPTLFAKILKLVRAELL